MQLFWVVLILWHSRKGTEILKKKSQVALGLDSLETGEWTGAVREIDFCFVLFCLSQMWSWLPNCRRLLKLTEGAVFYFPTVSRAYCFGWGVCHCGKTSWPKQLGKEGVHCSLQLSGHTVTEVRAGTQSKNLEIGSEIGHEEVLLTGLFSMTYSAWFFLYHPGLPVQG